VTPNYTITISQRAGHLYYQPTGQPDRDLLLSHSPGVYYLEEWQGGKIRFARNKTGKVDALVIEKSSSDRRCPRVQSPVQIKPAPVADTFIPVNMEDNPNASENPVQQTLQSVKKTGAFYTMFYYADYSEIVNKADHWEYWLEHENNLSNSFKCSIFYNYDQSKKPLFGRNFDNLKCDLLVGFYRPKNGYASIVLTRLSNLGFETGTDITALDLSGRIPLLAAPFLVADGMNEHGLAVGVASVKLQPVTIDKNKKNIHISAFCRYILDHARGVEQAVEMIQHYNIYDDKDDGYTVAHHLLVADPSGRSAILECVNGRFKAQPSTKGRQIVTNSPLIKVSEPTRRNQCLRYERLSGSLNQSGQERNWQWAMNRLRDVAFTGNPALACWSAVYNLKDKSLYLVLNLKYNRVYRLMFPEVKR
jgi:hypothetical protein